MAQAKEPVVVVFPQKVLSTTNVAADPGTTVNVVDVRMAKTNADCFIMILLRF
jgi:hypothetical protein